MESERTHPVTPEATGSLPPRLADAQEVEHVEVQLLLEGINAVYGFDFRSYAYASIRRRVLNRMREEALPSISALQDRVLHDAACMERLLLDLTVNVTAMFRDPGFYRVFREKIVALLRTYPFLRIWHAGCSSGEEVYSMAILLHEEGLYEKSRIYATDINEVMLRRAKEGIFPLATMQDYTRNYMRAGGTRSFSEYYTAKYGAALFDPALARNVVFSQHNLVTDHSFSEFHVVMCRNVMIYFNKTLQKRVHDLLYESLVTFGVLGLGNKESLRFTPHESHYEKLDDRERLFRKVR